MKKTIEWKKKKQKQQQEYQIKTNIPISIFDVCFFLFFFFVSMCKLSMFRSTRYKKKKIRRERWPMKKAHILYMSDELTRRIGIINDFMFDSITACI